MLANHANLIQVIAATLSLSGYGSILMGINKNLRQLRRVN